MLTFCFVFSDQDQVDSVLSSLSLGEKEVVLAPINDSTDPSEPESGSHWSLLVYCRHDGRFCHYDSLGGSNDERAEAMAGKLGPSLGCSEGNTRVTRVKQMPRQANGCDCVSDFRSLSLATLLPALLFAG